MNFDQIIDRRGTGCFKYDVLEQEGFAPDTIPLWIADMDFAAPDCVQQALSQPRIFGYDAPGEGYFRGVQGWFGRRFGWTPEADWLVETPGVVFALSTAVRAFTQPGDGVMMLTPVYGHFFTPVTENGRRLVQCDLVRSRSGRYEIDFAAVERLMDEEKPAMFILCSPHNPVGRVWTESELRQLGELCFQRGILVVSDEIHCDFVYPGHRHTPFLSLGPEFEQNGVCCTAPSKSFNLAGLQCSNIFIPNPNLRAAFARELSAQGAFGGNTAGRLACQAVYDQGEPWLEALLDYLQGNFALLRDFAAQNLPGVTVTPLEGTYLAWVDVGGLGLDRTGRQALLHAARIRPSDGTEFGAAGEGFWRINLACPRSVLTRALEQLRDAVRELHI